jgi:hypothetical protein
MSAKHKLLHQALEYGPIILPLALAVLYYFL